MKSPATSPSPLFVGLIAVLCFAMASCSSHAPLSTPDNPKPVTATDIVGKELNSFIKDSYSDTRAVEVLYATNRALSGAKPDCSDSAFGVSVGDKMFYGSCKVNVPKHHPVGGFEIAPNPRADPHRYFRILDHQGFENEEGLKQAIIARQPADVLVFVHGFNVKFEEAVIRASQIAYDVKFQGPVVLFTWPAGAGAGFLDSTLITRTYAANQANAAATIPAFVNFLKFLAEMNVNVHLVVHSMGHQLVLPALGKAADEITHRFMGEVVLNAPDIPVEDFKALASKAKQLANRVTLYCSYNDNAIAASEKYNAGRRMGGCERVDGIDVINVSEIDAPALGIGGLGHGYYASRPILGDVYQVLLRIDAEKRLFIRKSEPNSTEDYYLRP